MVMNRIKEQDDTGGERFFPSFTRRFSLFTHCNIRNQRKSSGRRRNKDKWKERKCRLYPSQLKTVSKKVAIKKNEERTFLEAVFNVTPDLLLQLLFFPLLRLVYELERKKLVNKRSDFFYVQQLFIMKTRKKTAGLIEEMCNGTVPGEEIVNICGVTRREILNEIKTPHDVKRYPLRSYFSLTFGQNRKIGNPVQKLGKRFSWARGYLRVTVNILSLLSSSFLFISSIYYELDIKKRYVTVTRFFLSVLLFVNTCNKYEKTRNQVLTLKDRIKKKEGNRR